VKNTETSLSISSFSLSCYTRSIHHSDPNFCSTFYNQTVKTKNITPTLAKILAQRVREKLSETSTLLAEKQKEKVLASKEYAEFEKLREQERQLRKKIDILKNKISEKYSTSLMKVKLNTVYSDKPAAVNISENDKVSVESIRDSILLDDHFATSPVTVDEMVDKMVKKFMSR
jgi:hypothetical protein